MTTRKYSSRSQQTTLSAGITSGDATATVVSGANLLSSVTFSPAGTFTVVIDPDTALEEIVDVTARTGNSLTITRAIDGSTAVAHSAGAVVRHMVIGRDLQETNDHLENTTTAHGVTGAVVGTTNTQTLTNKTLTSPTITSPVVTGLTLNDASIVFEGATADAFETTLTVTDPTADRTITVPDVTGTVVTTGDTGTVTSTMITDGTILNADVNASAGITYGKLSLTAGIVNTDVSNTAAISLSKLATDPLARANHTGTQTASTVSDFDTQVRTSRLDQMAAPTAAVALNSQKITNLDTPTASADAANKGYVDTSIANLIAGAPGTLDTLDEIAAALNDTSNFSDTVVLKSGSTMTGALTLSGAPTVDLHAATKLYVDGVAGSASAAAASAAAAAASYDDFDDRYLGAKASAPSVDNDGNSLIEGALYWNSVSNTMFAWDGSAWGSISSTAAIFRYKFIATGGETSVSGLDSNGVTLSYIAGKEQVYLNGILLVRGTDYTASNGTSITALTALAASDILEIITFTAFDVATTISNALFDAKGDVLVATAADTPGKLTVGVDGYVLKANSGTATGLEWGVADPLTTKGDLFTFSTVDARLAVGNNGETLVADSSTSTGLRYKEDYAAGKNKIINGDFGVWQRGTSFSNPATAAYTSDRWSVVYDGTGATRTISQQTFTPGTAPVAGYEGRFFYRFDQSVAGTGGNYNLFQNRMEDVRTFAGQTVTISFWGKAAASTSLVKLNLEQEFGTGGSPSAAVSTDIASTNFTLTTSWQRFTVTTTVPSISGKTIGTTTPGFLGLRFWIPINSTFTLDFWGVQVEESSVVTAFQTATGTLQGELAACQRYYYRMGGDSLFQVIATTGWFPSTTQANLFAQFPVQMRFSPSSLDFSTIQAISITNGNQFTLSSGAINTASTLMCFVAFTVSGATATQMLYGRTNNSLSGYLGFSAEL